MGKLFGKIRIDYVILGVITVALVVILIVLLITKNQGSTTNTTTSDNLTTSSFQETLAINNTKEIKIADKTITLSGVWYFSASIRATSLGNYTCANNNECLFYQVTDDNKKFYITTPVQLSDNYDLRTTTSNSVQKISGIDVNFTAEKVVQYSDISDPSHLIEDTSSTIYKKIYGCVDSVCFNSGVLDFDKDMNSAEYTAFQDFLSSVMIQ